MIERYSVKQVAELSGVSVRTLHHYDAIGLLNPAYIGNNGYRYYERAELLRLQQILFYRDLGMGLAAIGKTLDDPAFDQVKALKSHRKKLEREISRHHQLLLTIDETIKEIAGARKMKQDNPFKGFSPEKQARYEKQLVEKYGAQAQAKIDLSKVNMGKMSPEQMAAINAEGHEINNLLVALIKAGDGAGTDKVQALIARHHAWVANFWRPNRPAYIGLGQSYNDNEDFRVFYDRYDTRLAAFLAEAMKIYASNAL